MKSKDTVRKVAQDEIKESFESSGLSVNPGDLDDRIPSAIRISTTKEEFVLYLFEKSYLRPNFLLNEDDLEIPVFFVKADKDSRDFISDIREKHRLNPHSFMMLAGFHILKRKPSPSKMLDSSVIDENERVVSSIASQMDEIAMLKPKKRKAFINAVENIIKYRNEIPGLKGASPMDIFMSAVVDNEKVIKMFNESHYEDTPPKCIIVDTNKSELNTSAIVRLLMMHMLAFDIVIASYKSYSSIENYFPETSYDVHYFDANDKNYDVTKEKPKLLLPFVWIAFGAVIIYIVLHWGLKLF